MSQHDELPAPSVPRRRKPKLSAREADAWVETGETSPATQSNKSTNALQNSRTPTPDISHPPVGHIAAGIHINLQKPIGTIENQTPTLPPKPRGSGWVARSGRWVRRITTYIEDEQLARDFENECRRMGHSMSDILEALVDAWTSKQRQEDHNH